jgi:alanine dehydrogenase
MRWLDGATLRRVLPMSACIDAMEAAFSPDRETPLRTALAGSLVMPGRVGAHTGVKVVSTVPGSPAGIVVAFGPDGAPLGLVDGPTLTALRTAAGAGLATRLLAAPEAATLVMLGAGAMAPDQVAAVRAVRPITRVLVWSRDPANAARLADALAADGVEAQVVADPSAAVAEADVVSCATPATEPLFDAGAVRLGTHVNAVGAFTPAMCEVPPALVRDAFVVVDDRDAAAAEAGDLLRAGRVPDATVADLLAAPPAHDPGRVTLFKSVGIASQDVAAAVAALARADAAGAGTVL